jgi:hypothetical protein
VIPADIGLVIELRDDVPPAVLAEQYAAALQRTGRGGVVAYTVAGLPDRSYRGGLDELRAAIAADAVYVAFCTKDGTAVELARGRGGKPAWTVEAKRASPKPPDRAWMEAMADVARAATAMPGFVDATLHRGAWAGDFVPYPPIAWSHHLVTTTEDRVAASYEDPALFWRIWGSVETFGDVRLCTRALYAIDDGTWLGRTFEGTMSLARAARPRLTTYHAVWDPGPDYDAWWADGDRDDDKAGPRALEYGNYHVPTGTVTFAAAISRKEPLGSDELPRNVGIREIHEVRDLVQRQVDGEGRPVLHVRVIFLEEWMAREQRRPLLDVGAEVYYSTTDDEPVPVT